MKQSYKERALLNFSLRVCSGRKKQTGLTCHMYEAGPHDN